MTLKKQKLRSQKNDPNKPAYQIIPKYVLPSHTVDDLNLFEIYNQDKSSYCVSYSTKFLA